MSEEVTPTTVQILCEYVGIEPPPEDLDWLVRALAEHLDAFARIEDLELGEVDAAVTFDPRWNE